MKLIQVDAALCNKDKLCIIECPFHLLKEDEQGIPEMIPGGEAVCMKCGHCLAVCPSGALSLEGVSPEDCEQSRKDRIVDPEEMTALLKNRRSVRVYKNTPVEREKIRHLMEMLRWAPTARNLQPVCWLLIDDREKIKELARMTVEWLKEAKVYPEIAEAWEAGEDMILRSAPLVAIAHCAKDGLVPSVDCAIAAATLELAATSYGIGSFWAGFFMRAASNNRSISDYLKLPAHHAVYSALALGYPKLKYYRIPQRKKNNVHWL